MVANPLGGFPGESERPQWRSGRSDRRAELWLRTVRHWLDAAEKGGNRSLGPRRIPDPPSGERRTEGASRPRPPQAGDLPTRGETTARFPNNTARHRLSPAYFLSQLVSGATAPPPKPDLARDWPLRAAITPAPFRHCQDGADCNGGFSGGWSQRRRRRQQRPQGEGESRLTETAGLDGRGCRAGRSAGLGMS